MSQRIHEAREAAFRATAAELGVDPSEFGLSPESAESAVSTIENHHDVSQSSVNAEKKLHGKKPRKKKQSRYQQARRAYLGKLQGVTRGELARSPKTRWIYKQLWRHNDLGIVARSGGDEGPWAGNAWAHYVSDHWGKSRGEINNFSHAFYKALRRQVLPKGFTLPDGTVLEKSCSAIDQVSLKRRRTKSNDRKD